MKKGGSLRCSQKCVIGFCSSQVNLVNILISYTHIISFDNVFHYKIIMLFMSRSLQMKSNTVIIE